MRYGSVCSGIEAASVAWDPLGWSPAWFAEIEAFPSAVLTERWPGAPNVGDFTRIARAVDVEPIELLVGGTPCQSFSVAGKRRGLDDPRGNLTLEFLALAGRLRPRWVVWENVPGVLSDDGGRTFGAVLWILGELGYGFAYRVLDAQYFGVPQRRRRVFVVGCLGGWQRAAAVLFEPSCLRGDPPPRRAKGQGVAASLTHGVDSGGRGGYAGRRREDDDNIIPLLGSGAYGSNSAGIGAAGDPAMSLDTTGAMSVAAPLGAKRDGGWRGDLDNDTYVAHALNAKGGSGRSDGESETFIPAIAIQERAGAEAGGPGGKGWQEGVAFTMEARHRPQNVATFDERNITSRANRTRVEFGAPSNTLHAQPLGVVSSMAVRRLTPRECERLQGFPDDYTAITFKGKPAADGPRYRALGNSMAVPVMRWIGRRIRVISEGV